MKLIVSVFALSLVGMASVFAQTTSEVAPEDMAKFNEARQAIQQVEQDYTQKMTQYSQDVDPGDQAQIQGKIQELQQEAQKKMQRAVQESGLSIEQYNSIARAIQESQGYSN